MCALITARRAGSRFRWHLFGRNDHHVTNRKLLLTVPVGEQPQLPLVLGFPGCHPCRTTTFSTGRRVSLLPGGGARRLLSGTQTLSAMIKSRSAPTLLPTPSYPHASANGPRRCSLFGLSLGSAGSRRHGSVLHRRQQPVPNAVVVRLVPQRQSRFRRPITSIALAKLRPAA